MSPTPEQFSLPEKSNVTPTAGDNPSTAGHLESVPYDKEPLAQHYNEDVSIDTGQLTQVQTGEYWSDRPPARELPVEIEKKKNKRNLFIALGLGATGIATAIGAMVGATGNGFIQKPSPLPEVTPSASAPVIPGQTAPQPTESTPIASTPEVVDMTDYRFYTDKGEEQTFKQASDSHRLLETESKSPLQAMNVYFQEMETMINHYPSEQEVRTNLGIATGKKLTKTDYMAAAFLYRKTYDVVYDTPNSTTNSLYSVMHILGENTVSLRYDALNDNDPSNDPIQFKAILEMSPDSSSFKHSDNYFNEGADTYLMQGTKAPERTVGSVPTWQIPANTHLSAK
jgi:hypothetical protein